jgi:putative PIG3 family NAD(P)H quinone oxidoreductase
MTPASPLISSPAKPFGLRIVRMTVIEIADPGPDGLLRVTDRPTPVPEPTEVLVRVEAAGVNRPDVLQRLGMHPPPLGVTDIPGLEIAGTVAGIGSAVTRWRPGDRVCALVAGGGYAEYCVAPEPQCLPIPRGLGTLEAAAIPETFLTVWTNLFQHETLKAGDRILIHGGTSGIGTTAIQLARVRGAEVFATAGSDAKCAACERLGATAINYKTHDFVEVVRGATSGRGVDVILDVVGGDYAQRNIDCLAEFGRLVQLGLLGGGRATISLGAVMKKRLTITGSLLRPRSVEEKGTIARDIEAKVWPLLSAGHVSPVIDRTLPLTSAAEAHRLLEAGEVIGKLVLLV